MKNIIIFALLAGLLTACTNNSNPEVVNRQSSVISSGDGNFGVVVYGTNPIKSFVFKNNGTAAVSGTPILTGTGFDLALQLGCETIEPGKNCLVKIIFNSINKVSGSYSSTLNVGGTVVNLSASIDSVPSPSYVFSINGELITSSELSIGDLTGRNIKLLTVKVKNNSPKVGQISSLTLSNTRYQILQSNCNAVSLKPNQSCIAKVVVQGDNSSNSVSTQILFDGQSGQVSAQQVVQNLTGQMIALNNSVTLGDFYEEGTNKIQILKIENQGAGVGSIESSSILLPPGYSIGNNNCISVKPGSSCMIRLVYLSSNLEKGIHTDTVAVGDSDVDLTVNQVSDPNDLQTLSLTVAPNIPVGDCSPVSLALKDSENLDYVSSQPIVISASAASELYSDSSCLTNDSLVILAFESTKNLFIKKTIAGEIDLVVNIKNKEEHQLVYFYSPLTIVSDKTDIVVGQQAQLTVTGGKGPFSVETLSGGGTLTIGGLYTSNTVGVANFKVTDVLNQQAVVSVNVVSILTSSVSSFEKVVNQTQSIQGQNGLAPYSYSKVSGVGSIDSLSGLYSAGATAGLVQIKITDALNQEVLVDGQVYNQLSLSPLNSTIVLSQNQIFSASGGKLPYVFSIVSGVGNINSSSGLFSSLTVGSAQIKVVDALNQEVTTGITVNSNIVLSAGTCSYSTTPEQVDCTVSATGGIGAKTFSSSSGVIDSATGVFYGICANNLGESIVTVTDSQGNNQSITLSYPCVYKSCNQIKADTLGVISGTFWIDTDSHRSGISPFKVYCEMEENGGGWTLVAKYGNTSNNTYHWFSTTGMSPLSLDGSFTSTDIQIASYANSQVSSAQKLMVTFNGSKTTSYVVNNLTASKNKLWNGSANAVNEALGTLSSVHSSLTGSPYTLGNTVRMHFGTYGGNLGSGLTSGVSSNQTLGTIADCNTYCSYRLPGIGAIPSVSANWPLERNPIQAFVQIPYNKYPTSCADALNKGMSTGIITIDTDGFNNGTAEYQVYCDMTARTESQVVASGGVTQDYTVGGISYRSHIFPTGTTNLSVSQAVAGAQIDALIVAGGGGGGSSGATYAGGGGAGGMIVTSVAPSVGNYSMVVGAGGNPQNNGINSIAFGHTAIGGGAGASSFSGTGASGGSGGGGAHSNGAPGSGFGTQGFAGGWASANGTGIDTGSGGGGGAGGRGHDINSGAARNNGGAGGEGLQNSFRTGSPLWYAAGGCGAGRYYCTPTNGIGGATFGFIPTPPYTTPGPQPLTAGVSGTGSGGGGGRSSAGAAGGSGTIVIRYKLKNF